MNPPVVIIGGWLSTTDDYRWMARDLARPPYRRIVYITDIRRPTWLALRDPDMTSVLDIIAKTVEIALAETGASAVDLIGHSAGGRLARAYLGDKPYYGRVYNGQSHVRSITTLGTAHSTVEIYVAQFGAWVNEVYPGTFYPHISYRSVAGETVVGRKYGSIEEMLAYRSYEITCGRGDVIGDGLIPTHSCYLDGADNLVISGVRHVLYNAPQGWYGAPHVMEGWFAA